MKKNLTISGSIILSVLLLFSACQKEIKEKTVDPEIQSQSKDGHDDDKNGCRLVFAGNTDPMGNYDFTFHYNNKGLADKWEIANYGLFTQEYDGAGKLKKSVHTAGGQVVFTVKFFYHGDRLFKEIYYNGSGPDIIDENFYTLNAQGKIIKVQSFMNDWETIATYTRQGNVASEIIYFSGSPFWAAYYTYNRPFKNPYLATPGIDHGFPFYNVASNFCNKWRQAGEKQVLYDEDGNPYVAYDFDPAQTIWQRAQQNYPASATYYDLLSNGWYPFTYEYENCRRGDDNNENNSQTAGPPTASGARSINPLMLLKRNPAKSMKQQVKEIRQQYFPKH